MPLVTIGPRFYIVPLVPCTTPAPAVFVLALSRHSVRLIERATTREIELPQDVPRSLTDVVGTERRAASLQQHSVGSGSVFHGHGEGDDDVLPEIEMFCRRIASSLAASIDRANATLLLAGDVQITAVFRRAAAGWSLLEEQIQGSHDRTSAAELARASDTSPDCAAAARRTPSFERSTAPAPPIDAQATIPPTSRPRHAPAASTRCCSTKPLRSTSRVGELPASRT